MNVPNIFTYATSELSQDAFILWLLDWANPEFEKEDQALCDTAQNFVRLLLKNEKLQITSVECKKQEHHIDVFAIVNNQYVIILEDKTNTSEHGKQMTRYSKEIDRRDVYRTLKKYCIYFKTGNESQENIEAISNYYIKNNIDWIFRAIARKDILSVLNGYQGKNDILISYRDRMQVLETEYLSYKNLPISEWCWDAWQGFYTELANRIKHLWWGTVNAVSGAFICAAWHRKAINDGNYIKLQVEGYHNDNKLTRSRLCVKIEMPSTEESQRMSQLYHYWNEIKKIANATMLKLEKPYRFSGKGKVLTLAYAPISDIIYGKFDVEKILMNLKKYEELIDAFIEDQNSL